MRDSGKAGDMTEKNENLFGRPKGYFDSRREHMLKYIPQGVKKTLELGCASGNFSELVKTQFKAECWGIEIHPQVAEIAAGKLDKVIVGDAAQRLNEVPDNYFDCIICNDILEHLADPYTLLIEIKQKLTVNGVIVASLPNVRYCRNLFELVVQGRWDYKDSGVLDRGHLRFFTYKSLLKMFSQLGCDLLTIEGLEPKRNIKTRLLRIFTLMTFNVIDEIRYEQFACVARPKQL